MIVSSVDHRNPDIAAEINAVMIAAYRVEARIIAADDFPPLRRTARDIVRARTNFFGVRIDRELAAVAELDMRDAAYVHIDSLVVLPKHFRKGLAGALLNEIITRSKGKRITVSTAISNEPALRLYEKFKFREVKHWATSNGISMITLAFQDFVISGS